MKKKITHQQLLFICGILLFSNSFNNGNLRAQCTAPSVQALSASPASLPCNGNVTVALASSQTNVNYYLRNDANNNVISGPYTGNGGVLNIIGGNISSNTTFNVNAIATTRALYFDGSDDQVVINNGMSTVGDFTWEAWFKTGNTLGGTIMSIGQPSGNYTTGGKTLFIRNNRLSFDCNGIGYMEMATYLSSVTDNNWHHATITNKANYSGNLDRTSMYLDGQLVSIKSDWDITSSQNTGMVNRIGYTTPDFPTYTVFNGLIDDVKFWNTQRTNNELIADMSACPAGGTTGLEAFYKFENGSATSFTDNGDGTHPATPVNMPSNIYSDGRDACSTCSTQMTTKPSVTISSITVQSVAAATSSFCSSGSTTITTGGSETNVNYYMANSTATAVTGPVAGTGGAVNFATGTINSTTTYTITGKRTSGALNFDGVDDIISVTETPALAQFSTTPMTMEAWVYPTNISTIRSVIRKEGSYNLYLNNGRIYFEMYRNLGGGTNYTITLGQTILPVNQWSHIAASWQGGIYADIYLNGNVEIIGGGSSTNNNVAPLSIGRTSTSNQPFAGKLDDIRIWNTARTAAQIKANMRNCLTGSEAGLLLNYKLDDAGTTIIDAAGGDNNGTILNADQSTIFTSGVDNCGCTLQMAPTPTVSIYAIPVISANSATICSGNSAVITPTGAGTGGIYNITGGSFTVSPSSNTNYSITATSSVGCAASNTAVSTVSVNATPSLAVNSGSICSGQPFVISASGGYIYSITPGGASFSSNYTVTPLTSTNYTITGFNLNGCTATIISSVAVSASPTLSINNATICSGNSAVLTPNGANTYTITGGSYTVSPATTASYSLTGTGSNGCAATNTAVSTVSVNASPTISVNNATICSGNSVAIVPTGALSYTITGGTFTVSPGVTTSYTVTGSSAAGCAATNTAVATISVNTTPTLAVNNATICSGNSVAIVPTGALSYTITGGNFTVSPNTTGSYTVTGSSNGCTALNAVVSTVSVNTTPTVTVNNATICSGNSAVIVPAGAASYVITGGNYTVSPNTTTSYTVTGTTNGCNAANVVSTVSVNTTPTVSVNNATICSGNSAAIVPSGAASYTITGGNYTVSPGATTSYSVTGSSNGCAASNTAVSTVSVNATPTVAAIASATNICSGSSVVIVPASANTYTITGGNYTVTPNVTTSYTVTGTTNGCISANAVITISVNTTPTLTVNSATICSGNSVAIVPSGAASYTITGGTFTVSPNTTTSYSVTGMSNGCAASNTAVATISVNTTPTLAVNNATICSGNAAVIVPAGALSYTITGGTFTVSPNTTISYSVTGISNGCVASNTAVSTVSVNTTPTLAVNNATICSGSSVVIVPAGALSYTITGGTFTVSPNTTTSYSVTGISNGCVASNTAVSTVSVNTTPTVAVNNATICSGNSVAIVPSGATTYTITGGNYTVTPNTTTSYTIAGTTNSCTSANAVSTVSVNTTPTITLNSGAICPGNSYTLQAIGAATYTYSSGSNIITPAITATYSATGTGTNGCPAANTATATVSVVNTLTVSISGSTNVCSGRTTTLTATGATTYTWNTGITTNTIALSPTANTSYTVTGASGSCSNTAIVTLSVLTTPTVTVNSATICSGASVTITPAGANSYTISGGNYTVTPNATTSYTLNGTALNGCVSNNAISTVSVNATPTITANSATICSGNTVAIVPGGAGTYTISGGSFTVSPTANTTYSVSGTGTNGCISAAQAISSITVNNRPVIAVNSGSICPGSSVTLVPAGANTYTITGGSYTVSPTANTNYSVSGTGTNGCTSAAPAVATVVVYVSPTITVNSGVICPGNSFTLVPTGAATYTYSNGPNVIVNPVATANYSVTGTSADGCASSNTAVATVSVVNSLSITVNGITTICTGQTTTLTASGATTYSWSTSTTTESVTLNPTSTTGYTVYGASGSCSNTAVVTLSVNPLPTVSVNSGVVCDGTPFVIVPTGADTYSISGNTFTVTPNTTSSYTLTGTDLNGCVSAEAVSSVTVNPLPAVTASASDATICINVTATLTASGASTYLWSTAQTDAIIGVTSTVAGSETYTVNGTDANGCVNTATVIQYADLCTGIVKSKTANLILSIYPNPNRGQFIVEALENVEVTVMNALGQVVHSEKTTGAKTSISISHLDNGIYFVKATVNGLQHIEKIIKQ